MALATPISEVPLDVDKAAVDEMAPIKAAIDRGCSLSKFLYVAKDDAPSDTHYKFRCALFRNSDFEGALRFLKEKALLPTEGKLRVTGAGCDMYKEVINQILGLEVEFISEFTTIYRGPFFLISHVTCREALFYPDVEVEQMAGRHSAQLEERLRRAHLEMSRNNPKEGEALPALFILFGSACGAMLLRADGTTKLMGGSLLAGRALLGLGKALAGTSDYEELMRLAAAGNCSNIDTTVGEFMKADPSSNYGMFPKDIPLFAFGKLADSDKSLEDFSREDRAAAVVRMMATCLVSLLWSYAKQCGVTNIVVGGNGVTAQVMREMLVNATKVFMTGTMKLKFLRTGHTGAFGAMIATPDDHKLAT